MIKYIKRSELNDEKYNACIENSLNTRIYAYSWYLDIVADNWDAMVLGNYDAVMPLPWRTKYFIKYIYPPCFTQQLGVFSANEINNELIQKFVRKIPKKFKKVTIQFNSGNLIEGTNVFEKTNFILPLNSTYEELVANYNYERRRKVKHKKESNITIETNKDSMDLINLFKETKKGLVDISSSDFSKLRELIDYLSRQNKVDIVSSFDENGVLLGGAFFLIENKRIAYLFSALTVQGRNKQAMTFIIDSIIKKYSNSNKTLDFEGSMIPGIAFFFKSFGAVKETYNMFEKRSFL